MVSALQAQLLSCLACGLPEEAAGSKEETIKAYVSAFRPRVPSNLVAKLCSHLQRPRIRMCPASHPPVVLRQRKEHTGRTALSQMPRPRVTSDKKCDFL